MVMVSKSFIAFACLFGLTTSINAQHVAPNRESALEHDHDVHRSHHTKNHARNLPGNKLPENLGGIHYASLPYAFPFPSPTPPSVVEFRDLEALADRSLHPHNPLIGLTVRPKPPSSPPSKPSRVVEKRGLKAFADNELDKGKEFVDEELHHFMRRLKVPSGHGSSGLGDSDSAPQPTSTGAPHLVGFRDLGSLDDNLASNEGSIDDESQNLDRRIKITSGKKRPAPPPGSDESDSVVSYRDLEGLVARALADRTFNIDAAEDVVESLVKTLVKGSSGSPPTPGNTAQPSRRRARNWSSRRSVNLS
ncbi:hypothetical protein V8E53_004220 [Lactarius tabidus]